jgi:hypothetical protein
MFAVANGQLPTDEERRTKLHVILVVNARTSPKYSGLITERRVRTSSGWLQRTRL